MGIAFKGDGCESVNDIIIVDRYDLRYSTKVLAFKHSNTALLTMIRDSKVFKDSLQYDICYFKLYEK